MGQVLHASATTTEAIRRAIQNSQASLMVLAKRHGINHKTVAKWRKRTSTADLPTGPKVVKSTVLSVEEEAVIVAFRRHTLLPLDDCLYSLQATIPHLTRSSLHRCLQRHGISRIPEIEGEKTAKRKFKAYPINPLYRDGVKTDELDVEFLTSPTQPVGASVITQVLQVSLLRVVIPWMIGQAFDLIGTDKFMSKMEEKNAHSSRLLASSQALERVSIHLNVIHLQQLQHPWGSVGAPWSSSHEEVARGPKPGASAGDRPRRVYILYIWLSHSVVSRFMSYLFVFLLYVFHTLCHGFTPHRHHTPWSPARPGVVSLCDVCSVHVPLYTLPFAF